MKKTLTVLSSILIAAGLKAQTVPQVKKETTQPSVNTPVPVTGTGNNVIKNDIKLTHEGIKQTGNNTHKITNTTIKQTGNPNQKVTNTTIKETGISKITSNNLKDVKVTTDSVFKNTKETPALKNVNLKETPSTQKAVKY